MRIYMGIDNGVTGSIGYVEATGGNWNFAKTPTFIDYNYNKSGQNITRIDHIKLKKMLKSILKKSKNVVCYLEKPFSMKGRVKAMISAAKSNEATLVVLEQLKIPYELISSVSWQRKMLKGKKGDQLKPASLQMGKRLFPGVEKIKHTDYDGILIAEYMRREKL